MRGGSSETAGRFDTDYDVIIAGASFAGLAVAAQLRGKRVLLVDRKPVGSVQTSACGTLVRTLKDLGLEDAILQAHHHIIVHTPGRDFVFPVPEPFCTFDYEHLCYLLQGKGDGYFVPSPALAVADGGVQTATGLARGTFVVDASGWRAVLASQLEPTIAGRGRLNFGIETTIEHEDDGLHFWFDPQRLLAMGVGWAFPSAGVNRVGVGSYVGHSDLGGHLDRLVEGLGGRRNGTHGGFFPHALRPPLLGGLFLVGDAAGQCMALTGEGIRPALYFGTHLGRTLRRVLDGELTPDQGRRSYGRLVARYRPGFRLMDQVQSLLPRLPVPLVQVALASVNQPSVLRRLLPVYLDSFRIGKGV